MALQRILIANRGEIAVRIHRAASALGIETVQAYSDADADSLAVQLADQRVNIGPPAAAHSYLDQHQLIDAALTMRCDGIHPGYGFLAENAAYAAKVVAAGLVFVGPNAATIEQMGEKVAARKAARNAGVPLVPGSEGAVASVQQAVAVAEAIGFPVMIKASAGGGGKGIRWAKDRAALQELLPQAQSEARAAFGDDRCYIEVAVAGARHIEVQILGDGHRVVHLFERECSLQRKRQKVWEEGPAVMVPEAIRAQLCRSAVALAESVHYSGAGTVEFLYDPHRQQYYFLEMNTRIQVEHPVTEMITGVDLVQQMLRIAGGERLSLQQSDIVCEGHAIEVRLNAEDPGLQFMPCPGRVERIVVPRGEHIRFDSLLFTGYTVPPFYDSLLGKLIVRGDSRAAAIERLSGALDVLRITGIKTTKPLFTALCRARPVLSGDFHTQFLEPWLEQNSLTSSAAEEVSA